MSNTVNIPVAFGQTGTLTPIPQTDSSGKVNLNQGYTSNYSLDLTSNPNALPVERDKFNYLMNLITTNIIDWQTVAVPQWSSAVSYYPPSLVRYSASSTPGTELLYRAIATPPAGIPPTNTQYWEVEQTSTALMGMIPERDMGQITAATNLNTVAKGWYSINGVLQQCPNAPPTGDISGVLECYTFGTPTMIFQRFKGAGGNEYVRSFDGATWWGWNQIAYRATTLEGYGITNALWGRGTDLGPNTDLNTIRPTTGEVHVQTTIPGSGNRNYPVAQPGVLFAVGYNSGSSSNMTAQTYMAADGSLWARLGTNSNWAAWAPIAFNVQQYINNLLASNNTWTGSNTFNNLLVSALYGGLTWSGMATSNGNSANNAGFLASVNGFKYGFIANSGGGYGIYNFNGSRWSFEILDGAGWTAFDSSFLSLNNNRTYNAPAYIQGCIQPTTSAAARLQFEVDGSISFYALNNNLNGLAGRNYIDRQGNFSSAGSIFATGNFYTASGGGAVFGTDGNVSNSSIISSARGGRYSDLSSAINDRQFYVTNASFSHDVRLYWDGQMETWVDGGYQGTVATQNWVNGNFWPLNSFLRPDQGSWGGQVIPIGTTGVTLPGGGAWAYMYFDMINSSISRAAIGVAAGGSVIWPYNVGGSTNNGLLLRWRIY
jgi:hypothetical protein